MHFSACLSLGREDKHCPALNILTQAKSRIEELDNLLDTHKKQGNPVNISMLSAEEFWNYLFADEEDFEFN